MRRGRSALLLAVGLVWVGCGEPSQPAAAPPPDPITGEQLDEIQRQVREMDLPRTSWATVERVDDATRLVVHVRIDGLEDEAARAEYCAKARETATKSLRAGQSLELYIVGGDRVWSCR